MSSMQHTVANTDVLDALSTAGSAVDIARVTLYRAMFSTILFSIYPIQVPELSDKCKVHELIVASKQAEVPMLQTTTYKKIIDRCIMRHLIILSSFIGFDCDKDFELITTEHIK